MTDATGSGAIYIPDGHYLTVAQIAEQYGVIRRTMQQWIDKSWLPAIDVPGLGQLVNVADLEKFDAQPRQVGYPKGRPRKAKNGAE